MLSENGPSLSLCVYIYPTSGVSYNVRNGFHRSTWHKDYMTLFYSFFMVQYQNNNPTCNLWFMTLTINYGFLNYVIAINMN